MQPTVFINSSYIWFGGYSIRWSHRKVRLP